MNRTSPGLRLSKAIPGFLQHKAAEALSPRTLQVYEQHLQDFLEHNGDQVIHEITRQQLRDHPVWLRTEYKPRRLTGGDQPLSSKTLRNIWITLAAFYTWLSKEFQIRTPMEGVWAPKFESPPVEPLTKEEIEKLLNACDRCKEAETMRRRRFTMKRGSAHRDRALVLFLLDTGLRASELCALTVGDVDLKTGKIDVKHGQRGGIGKAAGRSLWRHLADRDDGQDPTAPLFVSRHRRPINKDVLRQLVAGLGKRVGIKEVHPHRFRHTFAISYPRSGGDLFTPQALLGHSCLDRFSITPASRGLLKKFELQV